MKSRLLSAVALLALVAVAFALWYLIRTPRVSLRPFAVHKSAPRREEPAVPATLGLPLPATIPPVVSSPLTEGIERMLARLEDHTATVAELAALRSALLAADPAQAIAAIRGFLRTKRDAPTGQEFALGPGGVLTGPPTLRLLLLDALGQIARKARSDEASRVAREILETKDSADEWALALRNIAWTEANPRLFLADKAREMLRYEPWRAAPSAGMLEAMDVIVFTKDASFVPDLDQARAANNELAHAADIALDRLAEAAPLGVLTYLNTHPSTLNDRPFLRADYFAKADLSQGAQRAQLEIYLGRPDIALDEKSKLLSALLTPASFVSDSLVTTPPPPDDGTARRNAFAELTRDWLEHDRFPTLRPTLLDLQQRLAR